MNSKISPRNEFSDTSKEGLSVPEGTTLTQQNMGAETDINNIVKNYIKTGVLPIREKPPVYSEINPETYHDMLNAVSDIQNEFMQLPAKIRNRFQNNPYQMMRFLQNGDNREEAIKLGIINPPAEIIPEIPPGSEPKKAD